MSTPRKRTPRKAAPAQQAPRDRLLGRQLPHATHRILIDQPGVEAAQAELAKVMTETRQVLVKEPAGSAKRKAAEKRRADAQAAVDACYEIIRLSAVPPTDLEELAAAHPPTSEQMAKAKTERDKAKQRGEQPPEWPQYDEDTYYPVLLEACTDIGMTADDWAEFLAGRVSDGEKRSLQLAVLQVQYRERAADPLVLPKGSTGMLSSRLS